LILSCDERQIPPKKGVRCKKEGVNSRIKVVKALENLTGSHEKKATKKRPYDSSWAKQSNECDLELA